MGSKGGAEETAAGTAACGHAILLLLLADEGSSFQTQVC